METKKPIKPIKCIGLTGPYCAGKNHIARMLEQRGLAVLDVDKLGHQVIAAEKGLLAARFGDDILDADGQVDRKRLGAKVFGKPEELSALEDIIHPAVNREILAWVDARTEKACVINAALLHRTSVFQALDAIIIVEAGFFIRLLRAKKRDKLPWAVLLKRFHSQRQFTAQYSRGNADIYRVKNSGFSGFRSKALRKKLESRINNLLPLLGIETKV
ncbi:MAG: dephospho-CoA kinase [Treponema sp.]|nr:dephospho-CoA kinase [Treponema sp.]